MQTLFSYLDVNELIQELRNSTLKLYSFNESYVRELTQVILSMQTFFQILSVNELEIWNTHV